MIKKSFLIEQKGYFILAFKDVADGLISDKEKERNQSSRKCRQKII